MDHAAGLKVWVEDLSKEFVQVLERPILPIGRWNLGIDSRQVSIRGGLAPERGAAATTTQVLRETTTHNARQANGSTVQSMTRNESGRPVHALATIYVEANLRLLPGNEVYRHHIITAARKHSLTPQSLAALIDAEAAKVRGVWQERSNSGNSRLAQGLAQFFAPAWTDVFNNSRSVLHAECQRMTREALLAKRLEAKYAIDAAAVYAIMNLSTFGRLSGYDVQSLTPADKAKVAYLLHHEGVGGALRLIGKGKPWSDSDAEALLAAQFGNDEVKAGEYIARYGRDAKRAYRTWLYGYTDSKINVNHFLVQDQERFATQPRETAEIMSSLGGAPSPRPAPLPVLTTPSSTAPVETANATASGRWCDPLDSCRLRSAGLASVRSATFGMVRNGGRRAHQGIDLIAVPGTQLYAVADGTVHLAPAPSSSYAYGNTLLLVVNVDDLPAKQAAAFLAVNQGNRTIGFFYAHLQEFSVKAGPVTVGTVIAKSGSSGNANNMTTVATGAHLHFEVRKEALKRAAGLENRVDPLPFLDHYTNG
jgi:murein DD-endopeptidase MepM/ murein hydrolase activator NlpD